MVAIEDAIAAAERERTGLSRRAEEVLARAAVTLGNDDDEYLCREPLDSHHQDLFDAEIVKLPKAAEGTGLRNRSFQVRQGRDAKPVP